MWSSRRQQLEFKKGWGGKCDISIQLNDDFPFGIPYKWFALYDKICYRIVWCFGLFIKIDRVELEKRRWKRFVVKSHIAI